MIKRIHLFFTITAMLLFFGSVKAETAGKPVSISVQYNTSWSMTNGKRNFLYELIIKNNSASTVELRDLRVQGTENKKTYLSWTKQQLKQVFSKSEKKKDDLQLHSGQSGLIYVEFETAEKQDITFQTRLSYLPSVGLPLENVNFVTITYKPGIEPPIVLGPPFMDGLWTAVYDPSWPFGHRRVFYSDGEHHFLPGRYAIDFIRVDSLGRVAKGNPDSLKAWFGFQNKIIAVANGTVSSVKDGFSESATISGHIDQPAENASGNYISVKIAPGKYVFYEHLSPNSIRVKPGQKIKKGEVIALLGFTGQATDPHLHFHVADRDSRLHAEGLPFVFSQFHLKGRYTNLETFGKARWQIDQTGLFTKERPASNAVVKF